MELYQPCRRQTGRFCEMWSREECHSPVQASTPRIRQVSNLRVPTQALPNEAPSLLPLGPVSPPPCSPPPPQLRCSAASCCGQDGTLNVDPLYWTYLGPLAVNIPSIRGLSGHLSQAREPALWRSTRSLLEGGPRPLLLPNSPQQLRPGLSDHPLP